MNKKFLVGGATIVVAGVAIASAAFAGSDSYKFLVRGNVIAVDKDNKTVTVYTTHATAVSADDLAGEVVEFNASAVKAYKWVKGKKVRVTLGGIPVGHEVVIEGAKRSSGSFNLSKITVNDNAFNAVGIIREHNETDKILKVDVSYTDYKSKTFTDKRIIFHYGDNAKFYTRAGSEMNKDELDGGDQRVKITGTVANGTKWEALKVTDDYAKTK